MRTRRACSNMTHVSHMRDTYVTRETQTHKPHVRDTCHVSKMRMAMGAPAAKWATRAASPANALHERHICYI